MILDQSSRQINVNVTITTDDLKSLPDQFRLELWTKKWLKTRSVKVAVENVDKLHIQRLQGQSNADSIVLPFNVEKVTLKDGQYWISISKNGRMWGSTEMTHSSNFQILNAGVLDAKRNTVDKIEVVSPTQLNVYLTQAIPAGKGLKYDIKAAKNGKSVYSGNIQSKDVGQADSQDASAVAAVYLTPAKLDSSATYYMEVYVKRRGVIFGHSTVFRAVIDFKDNEQFLKANDVGDALFADETATDSTSTNAAALHELTHAQERTLMAESDANMATIPYYLPSGQIISGDSDAIVVYDGNTQDLQETVTSSPEDDVNNQDFSDISQIYDDDVEAETEQESTFEQQSPLVNSEESVDEDFEDDDDELLDFQNMGEYSDLTTDGEAFQAELDAMLLTNADEIRSQAAQSADIDVTGQSYYTQPANEREVDAIKPSINLREQAQIVKASRYSPEEVKGTDKQILETWKNIPKYFRNRRGSKPKKAVIHDWLIYHYEVPSARVVPEAYKRKPY